MAEPKGSGIPFAVSDTSKGIIRCIRRICLRSKPEDVYRYTHGIVTFYRNNVVVSRFDTYRLLRLYRLILEHK